jgi:hypothetical protein
MAKRGDRQEKAQVTQTTAEKKIRHQPQRMSTEAEFNMS